jgi:RNA polymerase sigma-54 factor
MNLGLDLNLNVGLEQRLSPQMIQSLKLLQMNSMELETVVKQELETNPLLESAEDGEEEGEEESQAEEGASEAESPDEPAPEAELPDAPAPEPEVEVEFPERALSESPEKSQEIDWESYLEDGFDPGDKRREEMESPDERFEKVPVYAKSLQDHLLGQLQDREVSAAVEELVEYLVHSLDDRGYLAADLSDPEAGFRTLPADADPRHRQIQEILEGRLRLEEADPLVREAVHVLQSLEPPGIGARNLRECLLLQIRRSGRIGPLARRMVEEDFELLERLKIAALAKKYEAAPDQIQAAIKEIGSLEPHPGRLLAATLASPVIPDLVVEEIDGELVLLLNDRTVPSLRVSRAYANLLRKNSRATSDEKKFVRAKLNSATWLIRAIEQRKSTMLKVMHAIMESQPDFFKQGPTHLRPLILQDVADKISMHISTVSRVTNGKYVQTPHGIFELKYFFSAGVAQSDGSEVSSVAAKDEIKKLIETEDSRRPMSDQKIVEILKSKGLDVARRTVAKYRDQLEILPARLRKQY